MHYVIFNHYATTPDYNGGTRHFDMAKELINKGHQVTIVASSFNHFSKIETKQYNNEKYMTENIEGINFIWIKTVPYTNNIKRLMNIFSYYKNCKELLRGYKFDNNPNIVIGSTVHLLAAQIALEFSKKYKCKFYFEERDLWPQTFVDFKKISENNILTKLLYKYEKYFYNNAEKIIVLFNTADKYVMSRGVNKEKIIYLPNGYSDYFYPVTALDDTLEELLNMKSVVYTGSHGIANELDKILDLARISTNINFIFIGDGLEKERLIDRKIKQNINNVYFFNPIPKNQINQVLERATFSVISIKDSPLYKYGFSMNKIFDYLKSDTPIIMLADKDLAKEFDVPGIYVDTKIEKVKKFINENLNNPNYYEYNKNQISILKEKYKWKNNINKLIMGDNNEKTI